MRMSNETPRYYAQKILEWVERAIAERVPAQFRGLVRTTVATELYKRRDESTHKEA